MLTRITRPLALLALVATTTLSGPGARASAPDLDPVPTPPMLLGGVFGPAVDESPYAGRAQAARIFYQSRLPANLPRTANFREAYEQGVRTFVISWKDPDVARVAVGLASLPDDVTVYGTYFHEPEDDIARGRLTLADWTARTNLQAVVMRALDVVPTSLLMGFTVMGGKGRDVADYYAADVDVFGFDYYPDKVGAAPTEVVARMAEAAEASGSGRLLLGEFGILSGAADGSALVEEVRQALVAAEAEVATYFSRDLHTMTTSVADAWFA